MGPPPALVLLVCLAVMTALDVHATPPLSVSRRATADGDALRSTAAESNRDNRDLARTVQPQRRATNARVTQCVDCYLVVGVKTRAVRGVERRQTIRATWANTMITQRLGVRVVFLGCNPDLSQEADPNAALAALEYEKQTFGDLLTYELGDCVDAYSRVVDKTMAFYEWASEHYPSVPFLMGADDDVYVRLDRIAKILQDPSSPRTRYYAGQVPYLKHGILAESLRVPWHKNYLSADAYPLSEHAPRAIGAHYFLSMDLVRFLIKNRHALRGTGTIDDLAVGFWLRFLLNVRPVLVPELDLVLCRICHNAFVSFGELSMAAMRQIHRNLQSGDSFCRGFSWTQWITPSARDPPYPTLPPRTDVTYEWVFRVDIATRSLDIEIRMRLPLMALSVEVTYTPSDSRYQSVCADLDRKSEEFGRRLPLMLCHDVLDRLKDHIHDHRPLGSAHLALALSNLPPLAGGLPISVSLWISRRVLRWRAFLESLMAEIYRDIHVFVLDEVSERDPTALIVPDFVAVDASEFRTMPQLPPHCRRLVFAASPTDTDVPLTILFTLDRQSLQVPHVYVPPASLVFSDSLAHNPLALLEPSSERGRNTAAAGSVAVPHCNARVTEMLALLPATATLTPCHRDLEGVDNTVFAFDRDVEKYAQAEFVLAFEREQDRPGYIAGTIVAAFVAGSIPIYDGDAADVSWLFNPKSFIHCGRFQSLGKCAAFVMQVHESPTQYDAMRKERPIVNETAFYDVFSWHPDVLQWRQDKSQESMAARLDALITMI